MSAAQLTYVTNLLWPINTAASIEGGKTVGAINLFLYGFLTRGSPLKVFDNMIWNQPEIPLDSKIPSLFTEDSTRFICNVLWNFTNNLNYNS